MLSALRGGPAVAFGAGQRWRNLEGVMTFFRDAGLGRPGTWVSMVNAGVLEGVARGIAMAYDSTADDYGNQAARVWAAYLTRLRGGELAAPSAHAAAWSLAKRVGTDYSVRLAERHDLTPTPVELRFLRLAEAYNWLMDNRAPVDLVVAFAGHLNPRLAGIDRAGVDRLFSTGSVEAARRACEIAYAAALVEPSEGDSAARLNMVITLLPAVFNALATSAEP
ncbi:hypothetical protein [Nocardia sp. NPDC052566]|uniref:hypothetical protein n=1 Tax=Nocardia sp. NPDC052566 TaxID=3364330 RepID=UPI0037C5163F